MVVAELGVQNLEKWQLQWQFYRKSWNLEPYGWLRWDARRSRCKCKMDDATMNESLIKTT
jgi:hypothetical protein